MHSRTYTAVLALATFVVIVFLVGAPLVHSAKIDELRQSIADKNQQIADIEKEIAEYQKQLEEVGVEKRSLEEAIQSLDITRKKLLTDIRLTENKIENTSFNIEKLNIEISEKEKSIGVNTDAIGETLRRMQEAENQTFIETLLSYKELSDFWDEIERLQQLQTGIRENLEELRILRADLLENRQELESRKRELSAYRSDLSGQKQVVEENKKEKNELLEVTKNKESNYQSLLEEKKRRKEIFEQEVREFEAALRIEIDPASIPPAGKGILLWPLDNVKITQYFGNTTFATRNPQVYNGGGHNGIDLRASSGTRVKSALSGTVVGRGDTDIVCRNASYGKWVLIKHNNGLSTLYAHLSHISVNVGQTVSMGETIGFSGNTGYSTGPHLHFTVFASQGVRISNLKSRVCSGTYTIPLADLRAYLNPLSYL